MGEGWENPRIAFRVLDGLPHVGCPAFSLTWPPLGLSSIPHTWLHPTWRRRRLWQYRDALPAPGEEPGRGTTLPGPQLKDDLTSFQGTEVWLSSRTDRTIGDMSSEGRGPGSTHSWEQSWGRGGAEPRPDCMCGVSRARKQQNSVSQTLTQAGHRRGHGDPTRAVRQGSTTTPRFRPRAARTHVCYVRTALAACVHDVTLYFNEAHGHFLLP